MIPFQDLSKTNAPEMEAYLAAAGRVIRSGRYINGPEVKGFEDLLRAKTGASHCIAVSNGLDALRLILEGYKAMGRLKEGDEVIVPANTFIATFLAVTGCGLKAVAADVEEDSFCIDMHRLPVSEATKAVIVVHLFGNPCWNAGIMKTLRKRGILVIEDNAQAIGAEAMGAGWHGNNSTGNLGDAAAISFYPAKNVGAFGDAGAVLTNDALLAESVRKLANYGSTEKYRHEICGFNCRMDELQAAMLSEKLSRIEAITQRRRHAAGLYDACITNPEVIKPKIMTDGSKQVWHQYVVRHRRRDAFRDCLKEHGIGTEIHYPVACHLQPCYKNHPLFKTDGDLPVAEMLASEILSLPIADVTDEEIKYIADTINNF